MVDGFFVKRVQDVRESAAYLTVMTRYLTKLYQVCLLFLGIRPAQEFIEVKKTVWLMCFNCSGSLNRNFRAVHWPVAPESWRVMEGMRRRGLGHPHALSFLLQSLTTVLWKTRSVHTYYTQFGLLPGKMQQNPMMDFLFIRCSVTASRHQDKINISHFSSSVRQ